MAVSKKIAGRHAEIAFVAAFAPLGFTLDIGPEWGTTDALWWFARRSGRYTEAICCRVRWRPSAVMVVDMVASKLRLLELRRRGLDGNAAALNLYNFQVVFLKRPAFNVLPQVIPLLRATDPSWNAFAPKLAAQVAAELKEINETIWPELIQAL